MSHGILLTGIEFVHDYQMESDGNNLSSSPPDSLQYDRDGMGPINFVGWGRGAPLTGWDWEGSNNPERPACFWRRQRITMRVRLESAAPPQSIELIVAPVLNGDDRILGEGHVTLAWNANQREHIIESITVSGQLPNEVARHELALRWFVAIPPGSNREVLASSSHTIFSIFADPLDPEISAATGTPLQNPVTGLTKQRLSKITRIVGGSDRRCQVTAAEQRAVRRMVWDVHAAVNDSTPPTFDGGTGTTLRHPSVLNNLRNTPVFIREVDQWVMWLSARWNHASCIAHVQLMKTMMNSIGINARLSWIIPKTEGYLPDGTRLTLSGSNLLALDRPPLRVENLGQTTNQSGQQEQGWAFSLATEQCQRLQQGETPLASSGFVPGQSHVLAALRLIGKPHANGAPNYEFFEGCLYHGGQLFPGAIVTSDYPGRGRTPPKPSFRWGEGFGDALDLLWWWYEREDHGFQRFMVWVGLLQVPGRGSVEIFFDVDGSAYTTPYRIPREKTLLPPMRTRRP